MRAAEGFDPAMGVSAAEPRPYDSFFPEGSRPSEEVVTFVNEAARINVIDANGHPLLPDETMPHFDGQNGMVYFYSSGSVTVRGTPGPVTVTAARGLAVLSNTYSVYFFKSNN